MQIDACCRENDKCKIKPVYFKIYNGKIHLITEFRVRLMNPIKKDYVALDMTIKLTLHLEFELHRDFFLILDISKSQIDVLEYQSNFNSRLNAKQMTSKLNSL